MDHLFKVYEQANYEYLSILGIMFRDFLQGGFVFGLQEIPKYLRYYPPWPVYPLTVFVDLLASQFSPNASQKLPISVKLVVYFTAACGSDSNFLEAVGRSPDFEAQRRSRYLGAVYRDHRGYRM